MNQNRIRFPHGELTANDVMVDYLEDNRRRLKRTLAGLDEDTCHWQPHPQSNSIAVTMWHMGRLMDVFLIQHVQGKTAEEEQWFSQGWVEQTGYDPRGIGRDGWGSLNEYTLTEVADIPRLTKAQLLDHLDQVYDTFKAYIETTSMKDLAQAAPGFKGQFTKFQLLSMVLMDNVRHLGEITTIKALFERNQGS